MREQNQSLRVLVVDDEPLLRWAVSETLMEAGHVVGQAPDATAARRAISAAAHDAVLLDLKLPDSYDLGLLADIKGLLPDCQVMLMTAYATPEVRSDALSLGAYAVITKPFDLGGLEVLLRTACGSADD